MASRPAADVRAAPTALAPAARLQSAAPPSAAQPPVLPQPASADLELEGGVEDEGEGEGRGERGQQLVGASAWPPTELSAVRRRNVGVPKFLRNLFQMLEEEDPEVIGWTDAGTAFQVRRPDALVESVLPKYFKHNKVSSFQRQLNYFGFKKWTKTKADVWTFSHPFFLRDDKDKLRLIKRKERATAHAFWPFAAPAPASRAAQGQRHALGVGVPVPQADRPPSEPRETAAAAASNPTGALPGVPGVAPLSVESLLLQTQVAPGSAPESAATAMALTCAVANMMLAKIRITEFLTKVQQLGQYLTSGLAILQDKFPDKVKDVRSPAGPGGLFVDLELNNPIGLVIKYALDKRVLLITDGDNTIRMCPPLIVTEKDIDVVLKVLDDALTKNLA